MPVLTLTSDFGVRDPFVAQMKGMILGLCPDATIVDVTHEVAPGDVLEGALALMRAAPSFPTGTVHVAVVDPGVGSTRAAIACRAAGHTFVGPDNGLLSFAAGHAVRCRRIRYDDRRVAPTFHGRDVFAPAAARLAGGQPFEDVGPAQRMRRLKRPHGPCVLGADRFGNLLLSVAADDLPRRCRTVRVHGLDAAPLVRTYADVAPGALLAYAGSSGLLEVGVRDGSAAARLGDAPRGRRISFE